MFSRLNNSSIPQKMRVRGCHVIEKEPIFLFIWHFLMCIFSFLSISISFPAEFIFLKSAFLKYRSPLSCFMSLLATEKHVLHAGSLFIMDRSICLQQTAFHSSPGIADSQTVSLFAPQTEGGQVTQCVLPALQGHSHARLQLLLRIFSFPFELLL